MHVGGVLNLGFAAGGGRVVKVEGPLLDGDGETAPDIIII